MYLQVVQSEHKHSLREVILAPLAVFQKICFLEFDQISICPVCEGVVYTLHGGGEEYVIPAKNGLSKKRTI